jgi:ATP-dependent helicase YprA (DUF1998 family)
LSFDFVYQPDRNHLSFYSDVRAGGSGICKQLYDKFVECLESAVELLQDCTTCYSETSRYSGGCPGMFADLFC